MAHWKTTGLLGTWFCPARSPFLSLKLNVASCRPFLSHWRATSSPPVPTSCFRPPSCYYLRELWALSFLTQEKGLLIKRTSPRFYGILPASLATPEVASSLSPLPHSRIRGHQSHPHTHNYTYTQPHLHIDTQALIHSHTHTHTKSPTSVVVNG